MDEDIQVDLRGRLAVLDVLVEAGARYLEMAEAMHNSADPAEATRAICSLFGTDTTTAGAVLEMQARRWTRSERERVVADRDETRAALAALADKP